MNKITLGDDVVLNDIIMRDELRDAIDSGLMAAIVPEFLELTQDEEGDGRHKDNLLHTIKVVEKCPLKWRVRLAAFFHDIGKPSTREFVGGKVTFYNHEWVGAKMTRKIMKRLGYTPEQADEVARIVEMSGRVRGAEDWSNSGVRRFVKDAGDVLEDLLVFCYNDTTSKHASTRRVVEDQVELLRQRIAEVEAIDTEAARRPPINGKQVMEKYDLKPGPFVGELMSVVSVDMGDAEAWEAVDAAYQHAEERFDLSTLRSTDNDNL